MKHIVLVGFKNVGKSSVGKALSTQLGVPFVDSDRELERKYAEESGSVLSCREIMRERGEEFFRNLEHTVLTDVLSRPEVAVIAAGGGAPLIEKNQELLKNHRVVYVTAHKGSVYERIMVNGWPAFFPRDVDPYISFQRIWAEREPVYQALTNVTVDNSGPLEKTVFDLAEQLKNQE